MTGKFDVLLVKLKVLLECVLDVLSVEDLTIDDVAQIFEELVRVLVLYKAY